MSILDYFKKDKTELLTSHGTTWTQLLSGIITEEYNSDLQFPDSIDIFDEMRKSDWTVIAILRAIKQPLISAKWQIQSGWEEWKDKEISDFITKNLFEKIKFKHFLRESLGFLDFWFYYFEKIFEIVDWKIEWKEFAPRIPKAHYLWGSQKTKDWIDWHPQYITQQVLTLDEEKSNDNLREIPWEKIILFSFEKEGNNFEWVSILRNAYKHFFYKDLLYKISSISAERYGVWVPTAQVKSSMNQTKQDKLIEFLKNIRSNEQGYWVYTDDVIKLEIMTPNWSWVWTEMQNQIDHHDRKIYDSILAGFLNLTTWDWGSNALSKDQSSFFLRGLQWIADFFIETINQQIKELVDLNFKDVKNYPKLTVSDIGSISMDEHINSIWAAIDKWLIDITQDDKNMIRDILKMPRLTQEQLSVLEKEKENQAIIDQKKIDEQAKIDVELLKQQNNNPKKDAKLAEDTKKKIPTPREKIFTKNITEFEKFLNDKYILAETIVAEMEKEWQTALNELYDNSDTERVDWVTCLVYDKTRVTAGKNKIQKITDKYSKLLIDSELQKEIFQTAINTAEETLNKNDTFFSDMSFAWNWQYHVWKRVTIPAGQIDTFIDGYKSNMQWVLYNENRRVLEIITLNYWSEASVDLAKQTAEITINKNILSLSFITHPRALYKYIVYNEAQAEGFTMFKTLVPTTKLPNVIDRPYGITASFIFRISTAAQINKAISEVTWWSTAEALTWLWLHHGSFEYYYPIESSNLDIEEEIAKAQRDELQSKMDIPKE